MTPEQRQAWLDERRTGIGGSDAAAAVGLSKWKTPLDLWLDKRGELTTEENEPMRWGTLLEPVVRQEYANRTGRTIIVPERIVRHPDKQFAILTPDGIADASRLYEGKTARTAEGWGEPGSDEIPAEYMLQVQHGMFVLGLPVADVAVLIGGSDFRIYTVEADAELQRLLIDGEALFWEAVQQGVPPAPVNREDVRKRWRVSSGEKVGAEVPHMIAATTLARVKALKREVESYEDELAAELQEYMRDAAELTYGGETLATG